MFIAGRQWVVDSCRRCGDEVLAEVKWWIRLGSECMAMCVALPG